MIETCFASKEVDILLFLEGTYPFVKGGVSTWVHEMISNMPQFKFGIVFLGAYKGLYPDLLFDIPENIVHLQIVYLFNKENKDKLASSMPAKLGKHPEALTNIQNLHEIFKKSHGCPKDLCEKLPELVPLLKKDEGFDLEHFLHSEEAWDYINEQYEVYSSTPSFIDYFWNVRNMHLPLWQMAELVDQLPRARILHTISTGYAGLLSTMVHQRYGYPLILSEHGLYSKERSIELLQTTMFPKLDKLIADNKNFNYEHTVWLNFFDSLARTCYTYANPIISLYQSAQDQQIAAGADPAKTRIIPNGVNIPRFAAARRSHNVSIPKIVCFVGRIVRIKDVKTFIRSVAIMTAEDPSIRAWIRDVGNTDPEYLTECIDYIHLIGQEKHIEFIEEDNMINILAQIGLLILSSVSEGMPLVLLESIAAGVPVLSTAVGSCGEIIEGKDIDDRAMGKCGAVVPITKANLLAEEALKLLNNPGLWRQAQEVCIKRVEKYYDEKTMVHSYSEIYESFLSDSDKNSNSAR
ncbi:MAG: GT4 family glycosyltransferase PelF [Tatlockia sp.]|nr:GT4 family glycosyltransferase PelF [Tatlockia sp.]